QPELQSQLSRQPRGEQITRQTTPMLYYLSAGKSAGTLHHGKLPQHRQDPRSSPEVPASGCSVPVWCLEAQRAGGQLPWPSHQPGCGADEPEDLLSGSPASSTEESFKNDYREKLKVAQKKVLRETSFKRKDLQMSLPVRLRQKPSKRLTTEHLRSFSLTGAAGDAKPLPHSPSHLESLESFSGDEEEKRPPMGRTGGRKRVTKEQKKLCYSEPEKLDQLAERESWSRVRDGAPAQDVVGARRRALESRARALSSSSISRTELKQIQHTALVQYMERKVGQRPCGSQEPPQKRLPHPQWPPGNVPGPSRSRQGQHNEGFCRISSEEKPPEAFPPLAFVPPVRVATSRC
ncbi:SHRM1 protein, partial [Rhinopomastus cyanomelas]|nr:SHRM1 protein [Rhinopomastus cyanomelas]